MEIERKTLLDIQNRQSKSQGRLLNPNRGTSLINKKEYIKIKPEKIQFVDIEPNHKYQITMFIRNQSRENQKIRIIEPTSEFFTLNTTTNLISMAPGLTEKIVVYFNMLTTGNIDKDIFQDEIQILGNNFKNIVPLIAQKPNFKLKIPELFKLGIMKQNQSLNFMIPIDNYGLQDIQIGKIQASSPQIIIEDQKFIAKKLKVTKIPIKIKCNEQGQFSESLFFLNGHKLELRGICTEESIQILSWNGKRLSFKDFGVIYIGEKIIQKFHIVNSSSNNIECLIKIFSKNIPDYIDVKIDESKKTFISRQKPTKLNEEDKKITLKCSHSKFIVDAFSEFENSLILHRSPSAEQLNIFKRQSFEDESRSNQAIKSFSQTLETLYFKIVNTSKPIKIPIKFTPIIPKIYISKKIFEFNDIQARDTVNIKFIIKNQNQKDILLSFPKKGIFYVQGKNKVCSGATNQYKMFFRPLIIGQYSQFIKISLYDAWQVELKVYGDCRKNQNENFKDSKLFVNASLPQNINTKTNLMPLFNNTSNNFLASERKKRKDKQYSSYLQNKFSQRVVYMKQQSLDLPIDIAFDALENPKVKERKKFQIKNISSELFFKKDFYQQAIIAKGKKTQIKLNNADQYVEQLTMAELGKIEVKCEELDYGSIFIGSINYKEIVIFNKNIRPIMIDFNLNEHESLCENRLEPRKIEALCEARFNFALKPQHLGVLRLPISYSINKNHVFQLDILANVTLLNLGFSTKSLEFQFQPNQCAFEKIKLIEVANYGNALTKFVIIEPNNKCFSIVSNKEVQIAPNSEVSIVIMYKPLESSEKGEEVIHSDKIIVKVIGGAENIIRVKGTISEPKFSLKQTEILYPEIFITTPSIGKLSLRNHSKVESAVKIQFFPTTLQQCITIQQKQFMMAGEERKEISYELNSLDVKDIRGQAIVTVRGGRVFKIPVNISFCFPLIEIIGECENSNLDLGTVHILSNHIQRQIKLVNKMKSQIKLQINKYESEKLDYNLEISATNQTISFVIDKDNQNSNQVIIKQISTANFGENSKGMQNTQKFTKILTLPPGIETSFSIKFIPKVVKEYSFNLPFYLCKATKDFKPIRQLIKCRAVQPLFYVNPYHIHFENAIISQNQMTHWKTIQLVNPRDEEINWEVQSINQRHSVFFFSQNQGKLKGREKKTIIVYFKPLDQGQYQEKIKFYTKKYHKISVEIEFSGIAVAPRVIFNKNNFILPTVPIQVEVRGIIQIENEGYDTLTFTKQKITNQYRGVRLDFNFIDGRTISLAKKKLRIEIIFKSSIPISFTTFLELWNQFGEKISIPVSCTAQNCLLTIYPYLEWQESKRIVFDNVDNIIKVLVSNKLKQYEKDLSISGSLTASCHFIKKWCNFELNLEMSEFPNAIIESSGHILQQMIQKMTNNRITFKKPLYTNEDKVIKMHETYECYSQIIKILKYQGAFLNHIRPEFLLNMNDYLLYLVNNDMIIEAEQNAFEILSTQSWIILFYQLCKVFIEPHINEKFINKLMKPKSQKLPSSTLYSTAEVHIIDYLNSFLRQDKMYSFSDQGKIFQIIQKILEKTFGISLSQELQNLKLNSNNVSFHDFMIILSKFLHHHLQEFGLAMYMSPTDFFTMSPKEFLLFFISFMNHLVHFQNFQPIQFQTAVSEKTTKTIEIQNPSKNKGSRYWVKIFGSENFQPQAKEIYLPPKQKESLKIEYHCKGVENQEAKMVLVPIQNQEGFIHSHSLSFLLKNHVFSKSIVKKLKIRASLYEMKTINIPIQLPIQNISETQFIVKLAELKDRSIDEGFSNFYLLQPGKRTIKQGKDKCDVKLCPLTLGNKYCQITYSSESGSSYIYQIETNVYFPLIVQKIYLDPLTTDKQALVKVKIPKQNPFIDICYKFHKEMVQKTKSQENLNQRGENNLAASKMKFNFPRIKKKMEYNAHIQSQSYLSLTKDCCSFDAIEEDNSFVELSANFTKPYKQYSSFLIVESEDKKDIRKYEILVHVSIKPKIIHLKSSTKARLTTTILLPNKIADSCYSLDRPVSYLTISNVEGSNDLIATFNPQWMLKQQIKISVQNKPNFQLCIYKINLEATKPDPIDQINIMSSQIFNTHFIIDLNKLNVTTQEISKINWKIQLQRQHTLDVDKKQKILKGVIHPGILECISSLKVFIPKRQGYYEYKLNIKNKKITKLPEMVISQKLFSTKKICLNQVDIDSSDYQYKYSEQKWFYHKIEARSQGKSIMKTKNKNKQQKKIKSDLFIYFRPIKEIDSIKYLHFKDKFSQYQIKINLKAQAHEHFIIPMMKVINREQASCILMVSNGFQADGKYDVIIQDPVRFRCDKKSLDIRHKQKMTLKIIYTPQFIGENIKMYLRLKSEKLPDLAYLLEGVSTFQVQRQTVQIECYEKGNFSEQIKFNNKFQYKQKFRFQIEQEGDQKKLISFQKRNKIFSQEINPNQEIRFNIHNTSGCQSAMNCPKILITKGFDRKLVKQIIIKIIVVKDLVEQYYNWQCRARQTIFETIKFPKSYVLKEIKAEPEIKKCISFSGQQQNLEQIKLKFISLKPLKAKKYSILLITDEYKFRIVCNIKVTQPPVDDIMTIRTDEIKEVKSTMFRLTNVIREASAYKAYFASSLQQLEVEPASGFLEPYGKTGTPIFVKFSSQIHNKRVEDKLYVETQGMLWVFKVIGIQSKILKY